MFYIYLFFLKSVKRTVVIILSQIHDIISESIQINYPILEKV